MSFFQEQSSWINKDIPKLIKLIQSHPSLWDSKNRNYKNPSLRDAAFNEISRIMNIPALEIRKKYRILRTQYVREVRYIKTRGYGSGWIFYDSLKFLSAGQSNRKKRIWYDYLTEDTQDEIDQAQTECDGMKEYGGDHLSENNLQESTNDTILNDYKNDAKEEICFPLRKRIRVEHELTTNEDGKRHPAVFVMKQQPKERDAYAVLGEQVANELRALKNQPQLQQSLKCSILQAILDVNKALNT